MIVSFDLSDISSLRNAQRWKDEACKSADNPLVFLVGLKKDLVVKYWIPFYFFWQLIQVLSKDVAVDE